MPTLRLSRTVLSCSLLGLFAPLACRGTHPTAATPDAAKVTPGASVTSGEAPATPSTSAEPPPVASAPVPPVSTPVPPASAHEDPLSNQVTQCLDKYAKPSLTPADIKALIATGIGSCFAVGDPEKLAKQSVVLPRTLGVDARNGKAVEVIYSCSDLCPAYGGITVRYANTPKESCCSAGGHPQRDPAWGGYRGCLPPEVPLPRIKYPRRPGGPPVLATRSPCDLSKVTFDDGTTVIDPAPPAR